MPKLIILFLLVFSILHINAQIFYPDRLAGYNADGRSNYNPSQHKWDMIIIGSGTAGSVLAKRLSSNSKVRVLVLEEGGSDVDLYQHMPSGFSSNFNTERDMKYKTVEQQFFNNRKFNLPAGRGLGGSSTLNAMIYLRPPANVLNEWCQLNEGWCWNDMLPFFKKTENNLNLQLSDNIHGRQGEWYVDEQSYTHDTISRLHQAHLDAGVLEDFDQSDGSGVPLNATCNSRIVQTFILNGERQSLSVAMLPNTVISRENLYVQTYAKVNKLLLNNNKVYGVEYNQTLFLRNNVTGQIIVNPLTNLPQQIVGFQVRTVLLDDNIHSTVVLSAGTFGSPKVLLLSGIGPKNELESLNISVEKNLEGVGKNAQDDFMLPFVYALQNTTDSLDVETNAENLFNNFIKWIVSRGTANAKRSVNPDTASPLSTNIPEHLAFCRKNGSTTTNPDYQTIAANVFFVLDGNAKPSDFNQTRTLSFGPVLFPKSTGFVKLSSSNPNDPLLIDLKYLSNDDDKALLLEATRTVLNIINQTSIKQYISSNVLPNTQLLSDEDILNYAKTYGISGYHYTGTCKMGPDSDQLSVVNNNLKVHGLRNLYVADASIMPTNMRGNPTSLVVAIAEKLATHLNRITNSDCQDNVTRGLCRQGTQQ
ncbi:choline dehydrogenase / GMC-type oxidoreductase [Catovirus CTV1]|uniref:Choline dehydrogenase / GMC-type oxidoreductase n=1 Tax=Catovirus CTV1 TaxID=1977631 RepID=A0A1V0S9J5_9VIRU|nr:choline dehydrogenase / GMC-type oxidoreductase [Catovirus CTV1]